MTHFLLSEASLKLMMYNFGYKILHEYMENLPDDEDLKVLDTLIAWEMGLLYRSMRKHSLTKEQDTDLFFDFETENEESEEPETGE